jgi:ADP-ribosylation factor related protein 1
MDVPLLLLANKQDAEGSLSVEEIREDYEAWWQRKQENRRRFENLEGRETRRMGSLEVMGVSALKRYRFIYRSSKPKLTDGGL